eukprot:12136599-Heterocapsa_arctica.AAC.1
MKAGALRAIIADGVWTPQRAFNINENSNGQCLLCESTHGGAHHIWWDCPALNRKSELGFLHLHDRRTNETNKPECFWNAGVITTYWTTLPLTEHMLAEDTYHICKGTANNVYIDGSSYNIGASNYSGWGIWSPDQMSFNEHGPLKGNKQSSDRAKVRALVAALEQAEENIEVITANQYVRDTANVYKGKH